MKYYSEFDWRTGKRFFNPQQDMADWGVDSCTHSIREYQDLMAFLYLSCFVAGKEKIHIDLAIVNLEKLRKILVANTGYHPDNETCVPIQHDYRALITASKISERHPVLSQLYYLRQSMDCRGFDLSKRIMFQLRGGSYFQKWQVQRERSE